MVDDRPVTQAWARALYLQHDDDIDGTYSPFLGRQRIRRHPVPARQSHPVVPERAERVQLLNSAAADLYVDLAAERLGYAVA